MKDGNLQKQQNGSKPTNHSEERDLLTSYQQTVINRNLQNGLKSTNHSKERDLLTPLNSFYSTPAMLIDGSENATIRGDLNLRFRMLLKGVIIIVEKQHFTHMLCTLVTFLLMFLLIFFQEIILKRAADLAEVVCYNIPRTPTQIHGSQYPPPGGPPPTTASGPHSMMIGQHLTAITPDGIANGGAYVTISNPEGTSAVYGSANHSGQQQRIASSTDVNNNDVTIPTCTSGMLYLK